MGAPVETGIENFEEVILALSPSDRAKLIGWISETLVEEVETTTKEADTSTEVLSEKDINWPPKDLRAADALSAKPQWHEGIPEPKDLTEKEWKAKVDEVAGSWADHPMSAEELIEDIYSSRTISTREINLDD